VTTPSLRATPADVPHSITETAREIPVVGHTDVLVVGGGPAGVTAAVAAARQGASVTLLERYNHLGGLASGGMVLVLDDMVNGQEISVAGLVSEYIERLEKIGLVKVPPVHERVRSEEMWNKWGRWGVFDFHSHGFPKPITYAAAFDPDGWKRVSNDLVSEAGVNLRMHSWFSLPIVEDGVLKGAVVETKSGREALLADVVIDTTGDIDVASRAGADHTHSGYIMTLVFRLAGVDFDEAERFEQENPREARALNRQAKRILGGAWDKWWLKTPLPGVAWCNCPHMTGFDGTKVEDLTGAEFEGRRKINEAVEYVTTHMPGFQNAYLLDVAEQMGVRQTRLLTGEYVVTKEDVVTRRHFTDSVARGRDYYTPYRALLPRSVEQLLVAGRHYSATPEAQRMSREIPPCMAMGEAAGVAATVALETGRSVRDVDVHEVQRRLRAVGADPGDVPSANATIDEEPALAGAASSEGTVL
jgi:hypothetical protein